MDDTDGPVSRRGFLRTAAGATAIAGASGTAAAQKGGSSGGGTKTITVGPDGKPVFEPEELTIAPGTAVKFVWESPGHNVNPKSGKWGHLPLEGKGFSYTTPPFTKMGSHKYWCDPHKPVGMIGTITVQKGGASSSKGGSSGPSVPKSAKTLGIAAMSFMLSTLGLAYFFMKYGTDFETREQE